MNRTIEQRSDLKTEVDALASGQRLFSADFVLDLLKLILAGSPLHEILAVIAELVESRKDGTLCTIWLPDEGGLELHCSVAPSLPQHGSMVGPMRVGSKRRILRYGRLPQAVSLCHGYPR